ncbi:MULTISPECIES: glycosyltransferase family 4 protein [unclassified Collinsella]|uniref:glycosyltransferase family 4 protein n=1 Tax=unclassified Collinsella TaxID=2637548 RepID=UPI00131411CB|nr:MULTISPECIES: glycosyltransferase family 4 protein [unclassified Collinsella]
MGDNSYICIFSALFEPHVGGVEAYTKGLATALTKKGNKVIVVTMNTESAPSEDAIDSIKVLRLPCYNLLKGRYPIPKKNADYRKAWKMLKSLNIESVIINTRFYPLSIEAARFASNAGVRPIVIEHGSAYLTLGNHVVDPFIHRVEIILINQIKKYNPCFYGVSKKASEWLSQFGITAEGEIHNAIDYVQFCSESSNRNFREELGIRSDSVLISFAGRLVPEKGIVELIEAARVLEKTPEGCEGKLIIAIAGDGPLFLKADKTKPDNMILLGGLSRKDLAALMLQSDACCLPSRSEGFSTVLLEAAACGIPPIATDVGGMREIAPNNQFGILISSMRPLDIANGIQAACRSEIGLKQMGKNVKRRVENNFSWSETAKEAMSAMEHANKGRE